MYNNNGRPLTKRQTLKIMILWSCSCGRRRRCSRSGLMGRNRCVPPSEMPPALIELRQEATVPGTEVRLKHIARWEDRDNASLAPAAELIVLRSSQQDARTSRSPCPR